MPSRILRRHWWDRHGTLVGYLLGIAAVTVLAYGQSQTNDQLADQARVGVQTHAFLCEIKVSIRQRIAAESRLLPSESGVFARATRTQIAGQQQTLRSLRPLRCGGEGAP